VLVCKPHRGHAVHRAITRLGWKALVSKDVIVKPKWLIGWAANCDYNTFKNAQPYQVLNHVPGVEQLSNKKDLAINLANMARDFPDDYSFHPNTWVR